MHCLVIDTTSKFLCIAVIKDDKILRQYNKVHERQHSVLLLSKIEKVLNSCSLSAVDIDCLAVDIGPGSFTGLRIGIATAKGLSLSWDKPIIGLCSLDLIAEGQSDSGDIICPVIDAKRQQVYSAIYTCRPNKVKRKGAYFLGPIDELLKKLKGKVVFCGDALFLYRDKIKAHKAIQPVLGQEQLWFPTAASFSKLCHGMFKKKDFKTASRIAPMYLYQNTCTVKKKSKTEKGK
ncbi:MAG: tRNA (adenosine(37)-N6)-threonylcarbamoyltransferase complex dimerization subunit type 1 TsaB [Candidatus Omnitrophica bacterium]|nr:tRNA (adenosine(37)-N6)-threonylcarbamoyltransferase complex dimerization subunit type 1 TsaB [Candidatus Omnitrophota bacterium]